MKIEHLALHVRDPARSARFYLEDVGLDATATDEEWGVRVRLVDGFMLALIRGEPVPSEVVDRVHFGCALASPEAARAVRERMRRVGTREVEWCDEEGYTGVKVTDPDGYVIELSYDAQER